MVKTAEVKPNLTDLLSVTYREYALRFSKVRANLGNVHTVLISLTNFNPETALLTRAKPQSVIAGHWKGPGRSRVCK